MGWEATIPLVNESSLQQHHVKTARTERQLQVLQVPWPWAKGIPKPAQNLAESYACQNDGG